MTDQKKAILNFCANPSEETVSKLEDYTVAIMYGWCMYVRKTGVGKKDVVKKIIGFLISSLSPKICMDRRGLKSLLSACDVLKNMNAGKSVWITGYIRKSMAIKIYYGFDKKLPDFYNTIFSHELFGADRDHLFSRADLKETLVDFMSNNNDIKLDKIYINTGDKNSLFYDKNIGIIWSNEKCAECVKKANKGDKLDDECYKLIQDKCYDKIHNKAKFYNLSDIHRDDGSEGEEEGEENKREKKEKVVKSWKPEGWECDSCMLINDPKNKKCIACNEKRKN